MDVLGEIGFPGLYFFFSQFPSQIGNANCGQAELLRFGSWFSLPGMLWMQNAPRVRWEPGINS